MSEKILILMATYNGERFIQDQLESIAGQIHRNWELWVRDDGSTDNTLSIVREFAAIHPGQVRIVEDNGKGLGPCQNFGRLMEIAVKESDAEFIALSDQDDVWVPEKLQIELEKICSLDSGKAALVFGDLEIVDAALKSVHPSFWKHEGLKPENALRPLCLLQRNVVTGCTVLFNRKLLEFATPIPKEVPIHDWWLALHASIFGQIAYIDRPLVKYRQHGANSIGAQGRWKEKIWRYLLHPVSVIRARWSAHRDQARQAKMLLDKMERDHHLYSSIELFVKIRNGSFWSRVKHFRIFCQYERIWRCLPRVLIP